MLNRLLVTGAAGTIGTAMRPLLAPIAKHVRVSDRHNVETVSDAEESVACDLADKDAVDDLVRGCDAVIHLGGVSIEKSFDDILPSNIVGVHNLYEAARLTGHPRIVFASSNHAVGYHRQDVMLDATSPTRPDGWYGVSKVYGEAVASMYHDKFGIETAIVRIGSCLPEPRDRRMLSTWLSIGDFVRLIERCLTVPRLGCPIVYGMSDNATVWWNNDHTRYLGWRPQDTSEVFRAKVEAAAPPPDRNAAVATYQGGVFVDTPIIESE